MGALHEKYNKLAAEARQVEQAATTELAKARQRREAMERCARLVSCLENLRSGSSCELTISSGGSRAIIECHGEGIVSDLDAFLVREITRLSGIKP